METPERQPRWLEEEEMAAWLALAGLLIRLPTALDAQLLRDAGISHFDYTVMAMLSMSPERTMRMSELAAVANGSLSRLSRVVDRLERRGWVFRRPDPSDGRFTLAILTQEGWDKVVASAPGHVEAVRRFVFDALTKAQVRQLGDIGTRIQRAIDPESDCTRTRPSDGASRPTGGRAAD